MRGPRRPAPGPVESALLHAALDPPSDAVAHWEGVSPAGLLDGMLPAGTVHLLPLVWRNLDAAGWDDPTMPRLKGLARRTWLVNRSALHDLEVAIDALGAESVQTTLLGGPAAALGPWGWSGDVKYRSFVDAAVMVPPAERERAVGVLHRAGWSIGSDRDAERHRRLWHEIETTSPGGLGVRLVWRPSPLLERPGWWHGSRPVRVGDAASGVLDASDAFLTTCVEGVLLPHRHPLWVPDAYMILTAARVDLARCAAIAADHGEDDALAAALDLLGGEFGAPVPDDPAVWHPGRPERSAARSHRVPMASLRADWAVVRRNLSRRESLTGFAAFLADRWNLEGVRRVPAEAGRRVIGRLRRRSR